MLDHEYRVPGVGQPLEDVQEMRDVLEAEAGRGLIEDVERAAGRAAGEFGGKLDALRLATGERRRGLSDVDIPQARRLERIEDPFDAREAFEELRCLGDRHVQHFGDVLAPEEHFQRLAVVALAVADLAGDGYVREKLHFDDFVAVTGAFFAAPALHVEAEAARLVATRLRFRHRGEHVTDDGEGAGVGGRVRTWGTADRRLIDVHDLIDML